MAEATKADNPTTEQQAVINEIAAWIDTQVIAAVIAEELVDHGLPVTLDLCRKVWLRVLEDLHHTVECSIPRDI